MKTRNLSKGAKEGLKLLKEALNNYVEQFSNLSRDSKGYLAHVSKNKAIKSLLQKIEELDLSEKAELTESAFDRPKKIKSITNPFWDYYDEYNNDCEREVLTTDKAKDNIIKMKEVLKKASLYHNSLVEEYKRTKDKKLEAQGDLGGELANFRIKVMNMLP